MNASDDSKKTALVIMIVDADANIRNLAGFFLAEAGYEIEYACDGQEALDKATKNPPDIILLEITIPKLNGLSLCRLLKADPSTQNIRIVILSTLSSDRSHKAAQVAGADAYLPKPLEKISLVDAVSKVVNP